MGTECLLRPYCPSPNLEVPQLLSLTFPSQFRILANTKSKILVLYNKRGNENGIRGRQSNPAILPHQFWKRPGCWGREEECPWSSLSPPPTFQWELGMQPAVLAGPPAAVSGQETLSGKVGEGPASFSPSQWVHRPSLELRLPG